MGGIELFFRHNANSGSAKFALRVPMVEDASLIDHEVEVMTALENACKSNGDPGKINPPIGFRQKALRWGDKEKLYDRWHGGKTMAVSCAYFLFAPAVRAWMVDTHFYKGQMTSIQLEELLDVCQGHGAQICGAIPDKYMGAFKE